MAKITAITAATADILNRKGPVAEKTGLGTEIKALGDSLAESQAGEVFYKTYDVDADRSSIVTAFTAPYAMRIVDIIVEGRAASTNGVLTPSKGADAMCTAIDCAVDGEIKRMAEGAAEATKARRILAAGDLVRVTAGGDDASITRGLITFVGVRI